jgi:hypothetical protein
MTTKGPSKPSPAFRRALQSLSLYEQLDLRLLPGIPTARQCAAGAKAAQISPEDARTIYMAMIAADDPHDL